MLRLLLFSVFFCYTEGQFNRGGGGFLGALLNNGNRNHRQNGQNGGGLLGGILANVGDPMALASHITGTTLKIVEEASQVDVKKDLELMQKGPRPSKKKWRRKMRKFCRRYPGHPKCRRGRMPKYNELGEMLNLLNGQLSKFLPRVPRMRIRDPLANVNRNMVDKLAGYNLKLGRVGEPAIQNIRNRCRSFRCRQQSKEAIAAKTLVGAKILEFEQSQKGSDTSIADDIQLRMDRTQQLKEGLLEQANLSSVVVPNDNGVFDSDLLLTSDQANFMLNELGKAGEGADEVPLPEDFDEDGDSDASPAERKKREERRKRASLFFEENVVKKWDPYTPISYFLDSSLEELEKNDIRGAVAEIQRYSCMRFQEVRAAPTRYHIHYYKVDSPTFCGLSYVGRNSPANPIYLSFQCGNGRGIAIHETLHALGVAHQHLRYDRDENLDIDWSNINPQMYDSFVVLDSKLYTSYGVKYDYGSIMHYNAYTAAVDISKPTMKPKFNFANNVRLLGQRSGMSRADAELLNKMYCMPGCDDQNVYCGAWALRGLCTSAANQGWMMTNCKKSCNYCGR